MVSGKGSNVRFRERIEGAVGGGHDERGSGDGFLGTGQEAANGDAVAVPTRQTMFGDHADAETGQTLAGWHVGGSAGDLFSDIGVRRDDDHLFALFGKVPRCADATPIAALVIDHDRIAGSGLAAQDFFGGEDVAIFEAWKLHGAWVPALPGIRIGQ